MRPLKPVEKKQAEGWMQSSLQDLDGSPKEVEHPCVDGGQEAQKQDPGKHSIFRLCKYICAALVAIWLLGVFGSAFHSIAISQTPLECATFVGIAIFEVVIMMSVVCCWRRTFAALPKIKQLKRSDYVGASSVLSEKLRTEYIKGFPRLDRYAKVAGFLDDSPALHMLARLKDHRYADSAGFMTEYEYFQRALDDRALEIIKKYAKVIAIKTAASPWKAIDMISVFFNSTLMVCDLAQVYQRKTSRHEASRLVIRWFVNLYISGELGQVTEQSADAIAAGAADWIGSDGVGALIQPAVPLLAKFGGKIVEGGLNAYLAYRLGHRASLYFKELVD